MRILGVDPGLCITGYGVIEDESKLAMVEAGMIKTNVHDDLSNRLQQIYEGIHDLIMDVEPDVLVLEKIFAHYEHLTTGILMGHARGVICLAAAQEDVSICDIPSTRVKKAVVSFGHASKRQIQHAVQGYLGLKNPPRPCDVSDALAIAIAYSLTNQNEGQDLTRKAVRRKGLLKTADFVKQEI